MQLLNDLNIDLNAVVINIVGFLLLLLVLQKMVFKPIGNVLAERQGDINATYDKLDADRRQMEALRADYEQRLTAIEAEAREKIQSAIREAQTARDQIVQEAQERSRELITRAESEAEREREQAMITLRRQMVDLALGAATKVIGDSLDDNRQRKLIDDFITSSATATNGASAPPAGGAQAFGAPNNA